MTAGGASAEARILETLQGMPGVLGVRRLNGDQLREVLEIEARHESSSVIPLRNVGVRLLATRNACFVLLKDGSFRPPSVPTVYLVEEGARKGSAHGILIDGSWYRVVGEEVPDVGAGFAEPVIPLAASFVIYPDRRSSARTPCAFILPPIAFPELDGLAVEAGISRVISISPSPAADTHVRRAFDFPQATALATLLIGCDLPPDGHRSHADGVLRLM